MGFRQARLKAGKSVREIAEYMGVSDAAVYQWESGTYSPRMDKLIKLAKFYGCTTDALIMGNGQEQTETNQSATSG